MSHSSSSSASGSDSSDDGHDTEGQVDIPVGSVIKDRYEVCSIAGKGTFGTVLDVYDLRDRTRLALKVVRSVPRYLDAAQVEVDILDKIRRADVDGKSLCVRFIRQFRLYHRGQDHVVIAFEKLGRSLYDFLKKNSFRGFSLEHVADFGYQLLTAVAFCHKRLKLIHTDLKPENILLRRSEYRLVPDYSRYRNEAKRLRQIIAEEERRRDERRRTRRRRTTNGTPAAATMTTTVGNEKESTTSNADGDDSDSESSDIAAARHQEQLMRSKDDAEFREPIDTAIRLIDFGGATFEDDHHSRIVNTRQYRAPEVLLGCGWSYPSDLWSIGCILPELFTGELLFGTHHDLEHLALMERVLEKPLSRALTQQAIEPYRKSQAAQAARRGEHDHNTRRSTSRDASTERGSRERSSSNPRADLLLNLHTGKLKWPEGARSEKSLKTVKQASTLRVRTAHINQNSIQGSGVIDRERTIFIFSFLSCVAFVFSPSSTFSPIRNFSI